MRKIEIAENLEELNLRAAELVVRFAADAIRSRGFSTIALSGGSTPRSLYQLLSSDRFRGQVEWQHVFIFFGDERCVPPDSDQSNYRMARETLIEPAGIGPGNVFRWETELNDPAEVAARYERTIRDFFDQRESLLDETLIPAFDLVLLGMGPDGHTASLFPFSPALAENERLAAENWVEKLGVYRVTFTYPLLNHAANVMFLAAGPDKAETLAEVLEGDFDPDKLPAQEVEPLEGRLLWLVDRSAARLLTEI